MSREQFALLLGNYCTIATGSDVGRSFGLTDLMAPRNAFMESCFGTLKTELELDEYEDAVEAVRELSTCITYYNIDRRHSSLGYLTPTEFETQHTARK